LAEISKDPDNTESEEEDEEAQEELEDEEDVEEEETLKSLVEKVREYAPTDFDELVDDEDEEYSTAIDLVHEHLYFVEVFQFSR